MLKIDENLLIELGLGSLPAAEKNRMLSQIYETLELRVGMTLARQMSDEQLDQFERFIESNDEAGALKWLEANFPNYKKVVSDELDGLKTEIARDAAKIVEMINSGAAATHATVPDPGYGAPQAQQAPQQYPGQQYAQPQQQQGYAQQPQAPSMGQPQYPQPQPAQQPYMGNIPPDMPASQLPSQPQAGMGQQPYYPQDPQQQQPQDYGQYPPQQ